MVGNVGILLAIVFFTYAVLAVQMFGLVQPSDGEMNNVMNFTSFGRAWWTLFVLSTGEHWNACVTHTRDVYPACCVTRLSSFAELCMN